MFILSVDQLWSINWSYACDVFDGVSTATIIMEHDYSFQNALHKYSFHLLYVLHIHAGDDSLGEWRKAIQTGISFCRVASDGRLGS